MKDKVWNAEEGRAASGKGSVELVIEKDGTASGRITGALGPGLLHGLAEEDRRVSVALTPSAPESDPAMSGTVVLEPSADGTELAGTLRASSGSGEIVREAPIRLKRRADGG